jgi:hypothetical protein
MFKWFIVCVRMILVDLVRLGDELNHVCVLMCSVKGKLYIRFNFVIFIVIC